MLLAGPSVQAHFDSLSHAIDVVTPKGIGASEAALTAEMSYGGDGSAMGDHGDGEIMGASIAENGRDEAEGEGRGRAK
eukprot:4595521-Karenia_brevis.AAC.1